MEGGFYCTATLILLLLFIYLFYFILFYFLEAQYERYNQNYFIIFLQNINFANSHLSPLLTYFFNLPITIQHINSL